jgi:glutamyl/glutaminyl-tRNA synthetase
MRESLRWLGLDWDAEELQSANRLAHEAALDSLERKGLLYACTCSRSTVARGGVRAADGGWRYTERCRDKSLPANGWRGADAALRFRLPDGRIALRDESGLDLSQDVRREMGDPVLRRRDGAIAYHLAAVVDDARAGITRIVRGRDLATSTATHVALQRALGLATPVYRHHFLLLEESGGKLAKLHGSVGWRELRDAYSPESLRAFLTRIGGFSEMGFDWAAVRADDVTVRWTGRELAA